MLETRRGPDRRCFSSDSYGGSVTIRSAQASGRLRSHSTASIDSINSGVSTVPTGQAAGIRSLHSLPMQGRARHRLGIVCIDSEGPSG